MIPPWWEIKRLRLPTPAPNLVPCHASHLETSRSRHCLLGRRLVCPCGVQSSLGQSWDEQRERGARVSQSHMGWGEGPSGKWLFVWELGWAQLVGAKLWSPGSQGSL